MNHSVARLIVTMFAMFASTAGNACTVYGVAPSDLWNRLFCALYTRSVNGVELGERELDPLLWRTSSHLLTGKSYALATRTLDKFLESDLTSRSSPVAKAMLQRDLWATFDWAASVETDRREARDALLERLARAIRKVALTDEELGRLPDTLSQASRSGAFPTDFDPRSPDTPFLPADLLDAGGSWIVLSTSFGSAAPVHLEQFGSRSTFLVLVRHPEGRQAGLQYLEDLRSHGSKMPVEPPQFPAGTEFALLRRALLINDRGELRPTNLAESLQIRRYSQVGPETLGVDFQQRYEFDLSRYAVVRGDSVALRAVARHEATYPRFLSHGMDPIDLGEAPANRLASCTACHAQHEPQGLGILSVQTYLRGFAGPTTLQPTILHEASIADEVAESLRMKAQRYDWGWLQGFWITSDRRR